MLNRLSNTLGELYDITEEVPVSECAARLFLALRKLVPFDGAAMGHAGGPPPYGLLPASAITFGFGAALVDDFMRLPDSEPVARSFHANGMQTHNIDCGQLAPGKPEHNLRELAERNGIGHMLLSGTPSSPGRMAGWILLARGLNAPFGEPDCAYLKAVWPHLARCLITFRRRLIAGLVQAHGPGIALLNRDGTVAAADSQFESLCHAEWRTGPGAMLPPHAYATLIERGDFAGRTMRLRVWQQDGFTVCSAGPRTSYELLTRAERVVAFRYANGESYKEIAMGLSVSDNTVRTHLAHVFDKLGIHRKAELIRQISKLH